MLNILLAMSGHERGIAAALKGHMVRRISKTEDAAKAVAVDTCDVAIIEGGLAELCTLKKRDPRVEVILVGSAPGMALEAIREGASAFFTRPLPVKTLRETVLKIDKLNRVRKETGELEKNLLEKYRFDGIVGRNTRILDIFNFVRRVGPYYRTIIIHGETGTGKELLARAIHSSSPVKSNPFVAFNCGGVVENLVESELFGYKKGAFTGALTDRAGLFERTGEGTLFLDEIGDLPLSVQPHLLRVLENGDYRRLGCTTSRKALCRIVAATNRDLAAEVKQGRFREDLFYRLTPITIEIPPLRERKDDIPLLFRDFLSEFTARTGKEVRGISREAQEILLSHDWPGNVRELRNTVERAAMLTADAFIRPENLSMRITGRGTAAAHGNQTLDSVIREHIKKTLNHFGGNRTRASAMLGISRRALIRKIEKYSL
ncbi:MAG: sigma-54 dependent transcriptional regulator [Thermodesulfobacteriota bacterium]